MKTYEEMADSVLRRGRKLIDKRAKRRRIVNIILCQAGCFGLIALICFGVWKSGTLNRPPIIPVGDGGRAVDTAASDHGKIGGEDGEQRWWGSEPSGNTSSAFNTPSDTGSNAAISQNTASKASGGQSMKSTSSASKAGSVSRPTESTVSDGTGSNANGGTSPGAVYLRIPATYGEAKDLFGHPIVEYTGGDFSGYEIGTVTTDGNVRSGDVRYYSVIYKFQDGEIHVCDQSRAGSGRMGYEFYPAEEYNGRTFYFESENNIVYYPLNYDIMLTAEFGENRELSEIYDLLIFLEIKEWTPFRQ